MARSAVLFVILLALVFTIVNWSMGNLGVRNASHGCTGMSIANSGWLYNRVLLGDPVITTGSNRGIEQGNGWSDWDISYKQYKKGSAL